MHREKTLDLPALLPFFVVIFSLLFVTTSSYSVKLPCTAVCIVPVANALGTPPPHHHQAAYYDTPSMYDDEKPPYRRPAYSRIHQIVFNELVTVRELKGDQAHIELPGVVYENNVTTALQATAWVAAETLLCLSPKGNLIQHIPEPLSTDKQQFLKSLINTVVLTQPHHDETTGLTFSLGTRFRHVATHQDSYEVDCFDPASKQVATITLPKDVSYKYEPLNPTAQRDLFVRLVTSWAHAPQGFIPYVHGGTSATEFLTAQNFRSCTFAGCAGFDWNSTRPRTGLDCSGLIVRAAQIVGIPFFYKNSITMARRLKETSSPQPGDIIWIPGHVMVISSLKPARLIEARGYPSGFGLIQEIPLSQVFQGVETFDQLVAGIPHKKPLNRLKKDGAVSEAFTEYKVLSLV